MAQAIVRAIPTTYAGVRFRSRLEAEWAYNLDALGIAWCYEPDGVALPSGAPYAPDFWLPNDRAWLEVKGPGVPGSEKAVELADHLYHRADCDRSGAGGRLGFPADCCWGKASGLVVIGGPSVRGQFVMRDAMMLHHLTPTLTGDGYDDLRLRDADALASATFLYCDVARHWSVSTVYDSLRCAGCGVEYVFDRAHHLGGRLPWRRLSVGVLQ